MTLSVDQIYSTLKTQFKNDMQIGVFSGYLNQENLMQVMSVLNEHFTYETPKKFFIAIGVINDDEPKKTKNNIKKLEYQKTSSPVDNYAVLTELYKKREERIKQNLDTSDIDEQIDNEWRN